MDRRRWSCYFSVIVALTCFLMAGKVASAYDNDTHFWFTYYLAVKAGYTKVQAAQIASADVIVDFDDDTQPVTPSVENLISFRHPLNHFQYVRNRLHALPMKSELMKLANMPDGYWWDPIIITDPQVLAAARQMVNERKAEFWKETLKAADNPGVFIHFLEDTFAHDGFTSYVGHAGYFRVDYMASDRPKAERMALTTLKYLIAYREIVLNNKPAAQFADPDTINLVLYVNAANLAELKIAIQRFVDANPSTGAEPNGLVDVWKTLPDNERRERNNVPPPEFVKPFFKAATEQPVPDSGRARQAVLSVLGYSRDDLPYIWAYDLEDTGRPEKAEADAAYSYKERDLTRPPGKYTSDDEKFNKDKKKVSDPTGQRLCMPFKLVPWDQATVPACK